MASTLASVLVAMSALAIGKRDCGPMFSERMVL